MAVSLCHPCKTPLVLHHMYSYIMKTVSMPDLPICVVVDGNWETWSSWGSCRNCSSQWPHRERTRECNDPAPAHGGQDCAGSSEESDYCGTFNDCPPGEEKN